MRKKKEKKPTINERWRIWNGGNVRWNGGNMGWKHVKKKNHPEAYIEAHFEDFVIAETKATTPKMNTKVYTPGRLIGKATSKLEKINTQNCFFCFQPTVLYINFSIFPPPPPSTHPKQCHIGFDLYPGRWSGSRQCPCEGLREGSPAPSPLKGQTV